jgi:hypothetical protein
MNQGAVTDFSVPRSQLGTQIFSKFFHIAKRRKMALEKCAKKTIELCVETPGTHRGSIISRTFRAPFFPITKRRKISKKSEIANVTFF